MKYLNGKIYKLIDNTNGNVYIGSTCKLLKERLKGHRDKYTQNKKGNSSFDIIKNNDYKIELLEYFPCKSKQELLRKEREYIENNKCLNKLRPIISNQEMLDIAKQRSNEYHKNNRDKILKKQKIYREANKDKIAEKHKIYRDANKDKLKEIRQKKIQCNICNSTITRGKVAQHKRSQKCQNYKKRFNIN